MNAQTKDAVTVYAETYQRLYDRAPGRIQSLDNGWIIVNDARMTIADLELFTVQLQREIAIGKNQRLSTLVKLLKWIKQLQQRY